jgi:hypothetical protein
VYCTHCVAEPEDAVVRTKSLGELSAEDLRRYSFKAISTWGTVEQFKYLLPRLFQLVIEEEFAYNPEILFAKPRYGGLASWPETEKAALELYCNALWRNALEKYPLFDYFPSFSGIHDCLCSVAQIVDDLQPMLRTWELETTNNTLHLADFAADNAATLLESQTLCNAFWNEPPEQMKQVVDWFLSQDFGRVLDLVELGTMPYDFREELAQAVKKRSSP